MKYAVTFPMTVCIEANSKMAAQAGAIGMISGCMMVVTERVPIEWEIGDGPITTEQIKKSAKGGTHA